MQRTLWAEKFVDSFSSRPLTAEYVFHSPQYIDKGTQKELCDLLLVVRGDGILILNKVAERSESEKR